jgi:hypothetical protein
VSDNEVKAGFVVLLTVVSLYFVLGVMHMNYKFTELDRRIDSVYVQTLIEGKKNDR